MEGECAPRLWMQTPRPERGWPSPGQTAAWQRLLGASPRPRRAGHSQEPESGTLPQGLRANTWGLLPLCLEPGISIPPPPPPRDAAPSPRAGPSGGLPSRTPEPGLGTWVGRTAPGTVGSPPVQRPVSPVGNRRPQGEGVPVGPSPGPAHQQTPQPEDGGPGVQSPQTLREPRVRRPPARL